MDKVLTWFIRIWIGLVITVNLIAILGLFISADTFLGGWQRVQEIYSPFNVANFAMELILLAPAFAVYAWREQRRKRVGRVSGWMDEP
jgi:hypothetical protein